MKPDGHDQQFVEEITWRHVAGTRDKASKTFLCDDVTGVSVTILVIVIEGLRWLHSLASSISI